MLYRSRAPRAARAAAGTTPTPPPPRRFRRRIVPAARRGEVEVEDLPLPSNQQAEPAYEELSRNWETAVLEGAKSGKQPSLLKVREQGGERARADARRASAPPGW